MDRELASSAAGNLISGFTWRSSAEGEKYWAKLHSQLLAREYNPDALPALVASDGTDSKNIFGERGRQIADRLPDELDRLGYYDAARRVRRILGDQGTCGTGDRRLLLCSDQAK